MLHVTVSSYSSAVVVSRTNTRVGVAFNGLTETDRDYTENI